MIKFEPSSDSGPLFSVIIGAFNDWAPLNECLRSLAEQNGGTSLEVIVVDDGSQEAAPQCIEDWSRSFPLRIERGEHLGISTARNQGVRLAKGAVLLFVDADCKIEADCLVALASTVERWPGHNCFQLRLVGESSTLLGRVEELRLLTLQSHLLQPDGCIRYLNTAGFALRRTRVDMEKGVFDPTAIRAEDTLLLANMMQTGEMPFFVGDARVQHAVSLSLMKCLVKDIRSAYLEGKTYNVIDAKGVRIRVTHRERLRMLRSMWQVSKQESIGRTAWFVLVFRQILRLAILQFTSTFRIKPDPNRGPDSP
jgi:glycosyltransferase involved in cell wall biosynthesis